MALRADILRWMLLGIFAVTALMVGQFLWVIQDNGSKHNPYLRKWEQSGQVDKRSQMSREITTQQPNHKEDGQARSETSQSLHLGLKSCFPDPGMLASASWTPYKIFIYDLPRKFNYNIMECVKKNECFDLDYCGMGEELYRVGNISVRNTNQFALEVVLHHQLLFSPYRVLDPAKADVFYIPAYMGLSCFCSHSSQPETRQTLVKELFDWLEEQEPFRTRKLHISALAKIEREQASDRCPLLKSPKARRVVYATIEEEANLSHKQYHKISDQPVIVVPYPSYGHIVAGTNELNVTGMLPIIALEERRVFILLAAGSRKSNFFRVKLMDQFDTNSRTKMSYDEFFSRSVNEDRDMVFLYTQECQGDHHRTTITWMQHSIFCLQPPGDSPTRKSFYDAIIAGCIPVLFEDRDAVHYPFESNLNYKKFTVSLSIADIDKENHFVKNLLRRIPRKEIQKKLKVLQTVAKKLQYSLPQRSDSVLKGATELFMKEIGYNLATQQMKLEKHR